MRRQTLLPVLAKMLIARWRLPRWLCPPSDLPALAGWLHANGFAIAESRFTRKSDGAEVTVFTTGMVKANTVGTEVLDRLGC